MKSIKLMTLLMATAFVTVTFTACGDDDIKIERPDFTKVKYTCSLGEDFLKFYDVTASYTDVDGNSKTETITSRNWQYEGKKDGVQPNMHCLIVGTLKSDWGDLSATSYNLSFTYTGYKYDKNTSALEVNSGENIVIAKDNLENYLQERPTITILDFPAILDSPDK